MRSQTMSKRSMSGMYPSNQRSNVDREMDNLLAASVFVPHRFTKRSRAFLKFSNSIALNVKRIVSYLCDKKRPFSSDAKESPF